MKINPAYDFVGDEAQFVALMKKTGLVRIDKIRGSLAMRKIQTLVLGIVLAVLPAILHSQQQETVAVIGTGDMGDSLGPRFAKLGYRVIYGSRNPSSDKVKALVARTGENASATTQIEAAQQGDIILTLVPWPPMENAAQSLGNLDGKIILDASMPFQQGADGYPEKMLDTSSAELIQGWNPGAKVVKVFATMGAFIIDDPSVVNGPVSIPLASDHRDAKEKVAKIVAAMGLDPVDFGPLRMAREIETLQMIYMIPLVQRRADAWEFYFRRANYWECLWQDDFSEPVIDADSLAEFPETQGPAKPCP
jgi:predicted dinucleotide-binding enzyme